MDDYHECPNCTGLIVINKNDYNCCIFRHAVFKNNFECIPPHSTKDYIENLIKNDFIFGCGSPLQYKDNKLIICDYI
jgi:hypothetical protein